MCSIYSNTVINVSVLYLYRGIMVITCPCIFLVTIDINKTPIDLNRILLFLRVLDFCVCGHACNMRGAVAKDIEK